MTGEEATTAVIAALDAAGIPYMLVGSFASNFYGVPRATEDADLVVELGTRPISEFVDHLGLGFRLEPQMYFELITGTTRHVVEVAAIPFTLELFRLSDDPHDQERFGRRRRVRLFDREIFLPTVEDVVITKLRWFLGGQRPKDRQDARDVIAVQGERMAWDYVYSWCDQHGTRELLDEIRRSVPADSPD